MKTPHNTVNKRSATLFLIVSLLLGSSLACGLGAGGPTSTPLPPTSTPTPVLSPLEARVGEWNWRDESANFSFVVSPDGQRITSLELHASVGIVTKSSTLTAGEGLLIKDDRSFDFSMPNVNLVFRGQFSQDGTSATGLWEWDDVVILSVEWTIER